MGIYFRDILLIRISRGANNCGQHSLEKNIYFIMRFSPYFQLFYFNDRLEFCEFIEWKIKRINNADLFSQPPLLIFIKGANISGGHYLNLKKLTLMTGFGVQGHIQYDAEFFGVKCNLVMFSVRITIASLRVFSEEHLGELTGGHGLLRTQESGDREPVRGAVSGCGGGSVMEGNILQTTRYILDCDSIVHRYFYSICALNLNLFQTCMSFFLLLNTK